MYFGFIAPKTLIYVAFQSSDLSVQDDEVIVRFVDIGEFNVHQSFFP
jgi:hypothetical protein